MDPGVVQVTVPSCTNRTSTSPSRARRVKTRHRRGGRGSSGDLSGPKHSTGTSTRERETPTLGTAAPSGTPATEQTVGNASRGSQLEAPPLKLSSSSPDLLCSTHGAEGGASGGAGSLSVCEGLVSGVRGVAETPVGLDETPPRSDTASEDAASLPFSSSPDSPCCARGVAVGRGHTLGEEREDGAGAVRLPRGASGSHLTPSAILYRAAITRKQVCHSFPSFLHMHHHLIITYLYILNPLMNFNVMK